MARPQEAQQTWTKVRRGHTTAGLSPLSPPQPSTIGLSPASSLFRSPWRSAASTLPTSSTAPRPDSSTQGHDMEYARVANLMEHNSNVSGRDERLECLAARFGPQICCA